MDEQEAERLACMKRWLDTLDKQNETVAPFLVEEVRWLVKTLEGERNEHGEISARLDEIRNRVAMYREGSQRQSLGAKPIASPSSALHYIHDVSLLLEEIKRLQRTGKGSD